MSPPSAFAVDWRTIPNASDRTSFWKNRGQRKLLFMISIMYCAELLCGFDGTIVGSLQALPAWQNDLGHPSPARLGLLNAISSITGCLIGPLNAWVCDKYGRRWPLRFYGITMCLGTVIGVCAGINDGSSGYVLFVMSKAVIGAGMQAGLITSLICMQEITHPRTRSVYAAAYDPFWTLGSTIASFVILGTSNINSSWSWRIPYLIQLVPAIFIVVACFMIPETPRYLISVGREAEARAFFVEYHGNGDETDELVNWEFEEMKQTIEAESTAAALSWSQVFSVPGNKHRFFLTMAMTIIPQLCGTSIINFYYTTILTQVGITGATLQTGIGAGLNGWSLFAQGLGVYCLRQRFRRRSIVLYSWPVLCLCMAALMGCSAAYASSGSRGSGIASVAMIWLINAVAGFSQPLFYSYPAEILNYATRAKGMALWSVANQCSGIFNAFVNSIALNAIGWKYYAVYLVVLPAGWVVMYLFMVETRGYTLEEIAIAFEGESAAVAQIDAKLAGDVGEDASVEKGPVNTAVFSV